MLLNVCGKRRRASPLVVHQGKFSPSILFSPLQDKASALMMGRSFIQTCLAFSGLLFHRSGWALKPVQFTDIDVLSEPLSPSLSGALSLACVSFPHTAPVTLQSRPSVAWVGDAWLSCCTGLNFWTDNNSCYYLLCNCCVLGTLHMRLHLKHATAFESIFSQSFHRWGSWGPVSLSGLLRSPGHQVTDSSPCLCSAQLDFLQSTCCLWFLPVPWTSCSRAPTPSWSPRMADLYSYSGDASGPAGSRDAYRSRCAVGEHQHPQTLWFTGSCSQTLFSGRNQAPRKVCAAFPPWTQATCGFTGEGACEHTRPQGKVGYYWSAVPNLAWKGPEAHARSHAHEARKNYFHPPCQVLCKNPGWAQVSSLVELKTSEVISLRILNKKDTMPSVDNRSPYMYPQELADWMPLGTEGLQSQLGGHPAIAWGRFHRKQEVLCGNRCICFSSSAKVCSRV